MYWFAVCHFTTWVYCSYCFLDFFFDVESLGFTSTIQCHLQTVIIWILLSHINIFLAWPLWLRFLIQLWIILLIVDISYFVSALKGKDFSFTIELWCWLCGCYILRLYCNEENFFYPTVMKKIPSIPMLLRDLHLIMVCDF